MIWRFESLLKLDVGVNKFTLLIGRKVVAVPHPLKHMPSSVSLHLSVKMILYLSLLQSVHRRSSITGST